MQDEAGLQKPVIFHLAKDEPGPFPEFEYVNYERETKQVRELAEEIVSGSLICDLLLLGYPGNGKRAFARNASQLLWKAGHHVLWIDGSALKIETEPVVSGFIDAASAIISQFRPLLVVVEDIDSADAQPDAPMARLSSLIKEHTTPPVDGPLLIIATAELASPARAALPIGDHVQHRTLYFHWPDAGRLARFFEALDLPSAIEVAAILAGTDGDQPRYTTRSLIGGVRLARRVTGGLSSELSPVQVAKIISDFCTPTPESKVTDYLEENGVEIDKALRDFPDADIERTLSANVSSREATIGVSDEAVRER